jgi:hypothetical protein
MLFRRTGKEPLCDRYITPFAQDASSFAILRENRFST